MNHRKLIGYALILLSAFLWGLLPLFTKRLYAAGVSSMDMSAVRTYLAGIFSLCMILLSGKWREVRPKTIPFYVAYGTLALGGTVIFYTLALQRLSTAMAAVLLYTGPAFVNIFNRIFYGIPLTREKIIALIVTFTGSALVVRIYDPAAMRGDLAGIGFGILSGMAYSLTTVMGKKAGEMYTGFLNSWLMLSCGMVLFLFLKPPFALPAFTGEQWKYLIGLGLTGSIIPYMTYLVGLGTGIDGGAASILANLEVVVATLVGVTIFGDSLEWLQILGIVIVFSGMAIVRIAGNRREKAEGPAASAGEAVRHGA